MLLFLAAFVLLCFHNEDLSEIQILPHGGQKSFKEVVGKGNLEIEGPLVRVSKYLSDLLRDMS